MCHKTHKNVTLCLLWQEYRREEPDGYGYSWYCERYRAWQGHIDLVMRQEHRYGERLFVDWAGDTMGVVTPGTGEVRPAYVFLAVLGASNYLYAEASFECGTHVFLAAHSRTFSFSDDAVALIHSAGAGIPRRMNNIAAQSLVVGYLDKRNIIDERTVKQAVAEIEAA
jgi:hypothetical protein